MPFNWEKRPFQMAAGSLKETQLETKLPFSIGGVTKQGNDHMAIGISNQDAINYSIDDELIIGVLCDGCTTHHEDFISPYSNNQVGALLLSEMITNYCYNDIRVRKNRINLDKFLKNLQNTLLQKINKIRKSCAIPDWDKDFFLYNYFTTTILVLVIRRKEFFVFGCGDGYVGVNNTLTQLNKQTGDYLINWSNPQQNNELAFKTIARGATEQLNKVYLASDGFNTTQILKSSYFRNMLEHSDNSHTGFIDIIPEFHLDVIEPYFNANTAQDSWPKDDCSLMVVRRHTQNI